MFIKKNLIIIAGAVGLFVLVIQGEVTNALLNFVLAGVIPGTYVVIPYWLMMSLYSAIIAIIVTVHVERAMNTHRHNKLAKTQRSRMPRRRYSHI